MRFARIMLPAMIVSLLSLPLSLQPVRADTVRQAPAGSALYELSPAAAYYEGCVGACKCPVKKAGLRGSFRLARLAREGAAIRYRLDGISWAVVTPTGNVLHAISGSGTYRIDREGGTHRLTLDIRLDGGEEMRLDSGETPDGSRFPTISLQADRGAKCHDTWMDIDARPSR